MGFYDSTRDKDDTTVGVGHSRRYCNTGYDQSQGRRPSTLKCIGPISKGDIEPNHPSEINPNSDSRSRSDGHSRRFVQYRVDQSQGQRPRSPLSSSLFIFIFIFANILAQTRFICIVQFFAFWWVFNTYSNCFVQNTMFGAVYWSVSKLARPKINIRITIISVQ